LSELLIKSGRLNACVTSNLYKFAMGKSELDPVDSEVVARVVRRMGSEGSDFKLEDVLLHFVSAEAFRHQRSGP
jgi:hypothetical protein